MRLSTVGIAPRVWQGLCVLSGICLFAADLVTPLGFAHGTLYLLPIALAGAARQPGPLAWCVALAMAATIAGAFLSPEGMSGGWWVANRLVSCLAQAVLGGLLFLHLSGAARLEKAVLALGRAERVAAQADSFGRIGYFEISLGNRNVYWSEGMLSIFGGGPGSSPRTLKDVLDFVVPEERAALAARLDAAMTQGSRLEGTVTIETRAGARRLLRFAASTAGSGAGAFFSGVALDITEDQRRSQQLRLLRSAVEMLNDIVIITEADDIDAPAGPKIVYVNDAFERVLGFSRTEAIGATPRFLQGPETQRAELDRIRDALSRRTRVVSELVNYTAEGKPLWLEISIAPIEDSDGRTTHFVAVERDVTQRKQTAERIRASEERFRRITRATQDVVWELDLETDALWWSENGEAVFGLRPSHADEWLERLHPDDRDRVDQSTWRAIENDDQAVNESYRFKDASGRYRHVVDRAALLRDADGRAVKLVGTMRDTTELQEMEARLRQTQRLEAAGRLTGGIAHDINNLLTIILGNADLLEEALSGDGDHLRQVQSVIGAAERGRDLTARLLAFARGQPLDGRPTDLNGLIRNMQPLLEHAIPETIRVSLDLDGALWPTVVDRGQMEVALLNLIFNARDAMPDGGTIRLSTSNRRIAEADAVDRPDILPGRYVTITVADDGTGMAPEVLDRIYDPFFTTKPQGKGTGLGLPMVYGFVRQSGGTLEVDSAPGAGTSIRLMLPAHPDGVAEECEGPGAALPSGNGERILLVEDEREVRVYAAHVLDTLGYDVTQARDAAAALLILDSASPFQLLLTDVLMPGETNGIGLAREARRRSPSLRVLFASGNAEFLPNGLAEGDRLLPKPFRRRDLALAVAECLRA